MKPNNLIDLIGIFNSLILAVTPVVASLALLMFFWGLVKFILKAGDEKAIAEGKSLMVWGVVALFVMVSVWGLVSFLAGEFGFGSGRVIPTLPDGR